MKAMRLNKNDESHTKKKKHNNNPDNMAIQSPFVAVIILKVNKLNSQ